MWSNTNKIFITKLSSILKSSTVKIYICLTVSFRPLRLHCYDEFVEQVPEDFISLFPPEPLPQFKFDADCKRSDSN